MLRERKKKWTKLLTERYHRGSNRSKGRQTKLWEDDLKKVESPLKQQNSSKTEKRMESLRESLCRKTSCKEGRKKPIAEKRSQGQHSKLFNLNFFKYCANPPCPVKFFFAIASNCFESRPTAVQHMSVVNPSIPSAFLGMPLGPF
ncbi:hypothetical protein EVAR_60824_1 [Eumeta japonica]|uniref:Uncharacterized protein n=1 Tax=Eumeta variegata TaxID=151549 RepID=A0A4C1ZY39_EUMVA|nr:hypothetical protein EVAR_60824_1 [Eumeta japonica]